MVYTTSLKYRIQDTSQTPGFAHERRVHTCAGWGCSSWDVPVGIAAVESGSIASHRAGEKYGRQRCASVASGTRGRCFLFPLRDLGSKGRVFVTIRISNDFVSAEARNGGELILRRMHCQFFFMQELPVCKKVF